MKGTGLYLLGYFVLIGGILLALWKSGVLGSIGHDLDPDRSLIAIGMGIMVAVANSGEKKHDRGRSQLARSPHARLSQRTSGTPFRRFSYRAITKSASESRFRY